MESLDNRVIGDLIQWLGAGHRAHLVTVLQTWGSSPRPAGSLLAVRDDGVSCGSVSGGCIEEDLIGKLVAGEQAAEVVARTRYGVTREEGERFGLPCGGTLELLIEPLAQHRRGELQALQKAMAAREAVTRRVHLPSGSTELIYGRRQTAVTLDDTIVERYFGPRWRLLIIGAGDLSRPVAELALALDFEVLVCDPRPNFANQWHMAGTLLSRDMPDDFITAQDPDERTAIITLTHDPRVDDLALMQALESNAVYVGSLGSTRTHEARRQRLLELEIPGRAIDRLRAPIGLPIGSHTPMEIAVAIAAELVATRNEAPLAVIKSGQRTPAETRGGAS